LNKLLQSETFDKFATLLGLLPKCHERSHPAAHYSDSGQGEQKLVIRDEVSGGCVTQTEYPIAKFASKSKLNKRSGKKLIAWTTRADFNPSEICTHSIRQIER